MEVSDSCGAWWWVMWVMHSHMGWIPVREANIFVTCQYVPKLFVAYKLLSPIERKISWSMVVKQSPWPHYAERNQHRPHRAIWGRMHYDVNINATSRPWMSWCWFEIVIIFWSVFLFFCWDATVLLCKTVVVKKLSVQIMLKTKNTTLESS